MKLLLLGEHYSKNLGDRIISECTKYILNLNEVAYECLDLSGNVDVADINNDTLSSVSFVKKIKAYLRNSKYVDFISDVRNSYRLIKNNQLLLKQHYDAAVYIGGSLFMGYFSTKQYFLNSLLNNSNTKIIYNGCGLGTFSLPIEKKLLQKSLSYDNVKYISARDSIDFLSDFIGKKIHKTYDIALVSNKIYQKSNNSDYKIGIGYIYRDKKFNSSFDKSLLDLICTLEHNNIKWEIFCNGDIDDYNHAKKFYENNIDKFKNGTLANRPCTTIELVDVITRYSKILTCRLHSAIIAYSFQIPTIAITWSDKVKEFYKDIQHEELLYGPVFDGCEVFEKLKVVEYSDEDTDRLKKFQEYAENNIINICQNII